MKKTIFTFLLILFPSLAFAQALHAPYAALKDDFFEKPDLQSKVWGPMQAFPVKLLPQNIALPFLAEVTIPEVQVKALHNNKWLAVRMEWPDATQNFRVVTDQASDAAAIQLALKDYTKTSPFMGSKDYPVEIIHWKAIWQNDVEKGYQKVTDLYPNTWVDTYMFGKEIAMAEKNPVADPKRKKPVEELIAGGFGTLTHQSQEDSMAWASWENGKWTVVFTHKMSTNDPNDPEIKPGVQTGIAFAVWDGGAKNIGGKKNYAPWVPLILDPK